MPWDTVCRPIDLGGLGISNLRNISWALVMAAKDRTSSSTLSIQVPDQVRAFFSIAMTSEVGNDEHTLFWTDRWLQGKSIAEIAPLLFTVAPQTDKNGLCKMSYLAMRGQLTFREPSPWESLSNIFKFGTC
jgi:hypothetical protein